MKRFPRRQPIHDFRYIPFREEGFIKYFFGMSYLKDWDPAYPSLRYLFRRFELNTEQKLWLSWLYGVTYCVPSLFYIYNEFPDFEKVTVSRLEKWHAANWRSLKYQTDRRYAKGHLVEMFISYKKLLAGRTQEEMFRSLLTSSDVVVNFHSVWNTLSNLHLFGRFSLFIYTETLKRCCLLPLDADTFFLREAESSRNGLCYALGRDKLIDSPISKSDYVVLEDQGNTLLEFIHQLSLGLPYHLNPGTEDDYTVDNFHYETVLCAYKGLFRGNRYLGYYIDRFQGEITTMETRIPNGVCWRVLWEFRKEYFDNRLLGELNGRVGLKLNVKNPGVQKELCEVFKSTGKLVNWEILGEYLDKNSLCVP